MRSYTRLFWPSSCSKICAPWPGESGPGNWLHAHESLFTNDPLSRTIVMEVNPTLLNALANETILIVCQALDDDDLLILCQVSKRLHTLSLNTFFLRHGISEADIKAGNISLSSNSLRGVQLALFISSINKLSCAFHRTTAESSDMLAMERLVSMVPHIREVEVAIDAIPSRESTPNENITEAVLSLLFALLPNKLGTFLVLQDGNFTVSKRRRMVQRPELLCLTNCSCRVTNYVSFFVLIGLYFLTRGAVNLASRVVSLIIDPLARSRQDDRIRDDVCFGFRTPHSFHVRYPALPVPPFGKWTMIIFNNSTMTRLDITSMPLLNANWSTLLPSIHLPSLRQLTIGGGVNLDFSDFLAFVCRHPTINDLYIGHFSIQYSSLSPLPVNCLSNLKSLSAPPRHIIRILRSPQHFPHLHRVDIGPAPTMAGRYPRDYHPDPKAKVETPFSFDDLNEALQVVGDSNIQDLTVTVTIPIGLRSEQWLSRLDDD